MPRGGGGNSIEFYTRLILGETTQRHRLKVCCKSEQGNYELTRAALSTCSRSKSNFLSIEECKDDTYASLHGAAEVLVGEIQE
jgi:hypothetical protein